MTNLAISLDQSDTESEHCALLPQRFFEMFTSPRRHSDYGDYELGCSILVLPSTLDEYWEQVGYYTRRKWRRAARLGYSCQKIDPNDYLNDIYEINTSKDLRQGRPMKEQYLKRPTPSSPLPDYPCPKHRLVRYGVLFEEQLVAYAWVYQVGEMCLFSTLLGHANHLDEGVMYYMIVEVLRDFIATSGTRYAMYNLHESGTPGLKYFKEKMGFRPFDVQWRLNDSETSPTSSA